MISRAPQLLKLKPAGARVGRSVKSMRRAIAKGEIAVHQIGREMLISEDDLAAYIAVRRILKQPSTSDHEKPQ